MSKMRTGPRNRLRGRRLKAAKRAWRRNAKRNNGVVVLYPAWIYLLEAI